MVMGTVGIKDTQTASLYELAFTAMSSVSGQCCEVKQQRAKLVAGWVTQALEQGRLGSCAHAGYHQHYTSCRTTTLNFSSLNLDKFAVKSLSYSFAYRLFLFCLSVSLQFL